MAFQPNFTVLIFFCITILYCHSGQSDAATLPDNEIESLKIIAQTIGKGDWDFNGKPCGFDGLRCNCSDVNNTVCHVTNITLGSQNLAGVLPPELGNLTRLEELDLADNYLTGSIPPRLGSLAFLKILSLSSNLLSGPVPKELGDLSKLVELKIHTNNLSGVIPREIWGLRMLEKLHLSSNQFIGEIFPTKVILNDLTEFWASSNHFNGTIPSVIGKLTKLQKLRLQGTLLKGPIPDLSRLDDLEDLRISDIRQGGNSSLNFVLSLKNLRTLVLRNNFITATIPDGLENLSKLRTLDLSFNNLSGSIPESLQFSKLEFLFLGNNSLTGNLPSWLSTSSATIDLSYNNLSGDIKSDLLNKPKINLIWNSLKPPDDDSWVGCLQRNYQCRNKARNYGMAINCGGKKLKISAKNFIFHEFEDDADQEVPLVYRKQWGVTDVGYFMDNESKTQYTVQGDTSFTRDKYNSSVTISNIELELYKTARVSPMSLRYYGLDLQPGLYNVELHFVEIQFPNNKTSKGVRIYDVYIQGETVLKDFNIRETAGNKNLVVVNYHINVTKKVLEIHFFWAGKGTCCEPLNGTYGPLISAITVVPLFDPYIPKKSKTVMVVTIVAVVIVIWSLMLVLSVVFNKKRKKGENICSCLREDKDKEMNTIEGNSFSLRIMKIATKNFDPKNKIGEGGFGAVYKGILPDGRKVAIKQLSSQSKQGNREFLSEVGTISAVQHPHLVKLYGCCVEEELLLVYEYMENGDLSHALFGPNESRVKLDWPTRYRICLGVARGLAHLLEESPLKIVHRDIKSTNILLDKDLNPKVTDFGLARLFDEENTHVSTRVVGTIGYMAPEYALKGHLTDKADVYSFGVVVLEIISGRSHADTNLEEERAYLLEWAWQLYEEKKILKLVDMYLLHSGYNEEEVVRMIYVGLLCTNENPGGRPSMSAVVDMLEGRMEIPSPQSRPAYLNN